MITFTDGSSINLDFLNGLLDEVLKLIIILNIDISSVEVLVVLSLNHGPDSFLTLKQILNNIIHNVDACQGQARFIGTHKASVASKFLEGDLPMHVEPQLVFIFELITFRDTYIELRGLGRLNEHFKVGLKKLHNLSTLMTGMLIHHKNRLFSTIDILE